MTVPSKRSLTVLPFSIFSLILSISLTLRAFDLDLTQELRHLDKLQIYLMEYDFADIRNGILL